MNFLSFLPPILADKVSRICPECQGTGKHPKYMCNLEMCSHCDGSGREWLWFKEKNAGHSYEKGSDGN